MQVDGTEVLAETPADGETTTQAETETKDFVTLADEDEGEDAESKEEEEGETEEDGEPKPEAPKKPSGSARLKAQLRAARLELEQLRQAPAPRAPAAKDGAKDDLVEPKESDFPNDYLAYDRAMRAYETKKVLREEDARKASANAEADAQRAHRARLTAYNTRLESVKDRIPDFDTTMKATSTVDIRDDVRDLILDDTKGPLIAYHLAKNPDKLDALNRMTPIEAAREIGKLSARIRGPQAKTVTKAKPPLSVPKGGAVSSSTKDPSKMSMEEYYAWRESQEK